MSKIMDVAIRRAELQSEREASYRIGARLDAAVKSGEAGSAFQNSVLGRVVSENYERAIEEIKSYVADKSEFPQYAERVERYQRHAVDLINAIRAKRSFPGLNQLTMSKQQDLVDRATQHFHELKSTLKRIVQIYQEVRIEDVRSTVWVLKASVYGVVGVMAVGILLEFSKGTLDAFNVVLESGLSSVINWAFDKIGM